VRCSCTVLAHWYTSWLRGDFHSISCCSMSHAVPSAIISIFELADFDLFELTCAMPCTARCSVPIQPSGCHYQPWPPGKGRQRRHIRPHHSSGRWWQLGQQVPCGHCTGVMPLGAQVCMPGISTAAAAGTQCSAVQDVCECVCVAARRGSYEWFGSLGGAMPAPFNFLN
jgi:hypothetical protein